MTQHEREVMQMALTELIHCRVFVTTSEKIKHPEGTEQYDIATEALRALLAQPDKEWVGLTDNEYELMAEKRVTNYFFNTLDYAHDIEAKLKEKNI